VYEKHGLTCFYSHNTLRKGLKIISQIMNIDCYGATDVGLKRTNNEDAFAVKPDLGVCLVADGMGGAAAGEVASRIFADTTLEVFSGDANRSEHEILALVQQAFMMANERILNHVNENPDHKGMGCTAEVTAFFSNEIIIGHVGDSRTYRFRDSHLKQLSADHSVVQEQIDEGIITPEEAWTHPMRNIILRAVGVKKTVEPDLLRGKALEGDIFLLCSDGLTDMVNDQAIADVLGSVGSLSEKTENLIALAKSAGGRDNITVVLVRVK
jgi:protein phosphatase